MEEEILGQYRVPGINRTGMPQIPEKSLLLRDSEKTQLYPFSALPIEELDRAIALESIFEKVSEKEPEF